MMNTNNKKLQRSEKEKVLAGVAGGLANYFDLDPVLFRVLFVVMTLWGGSGGLIYIILWIVMPLESNKNKDSDEYIKENAQEIKDKANDFVDEVSDVAKRKDTNVIAGLILLIIGLLFLSSNFRLFNFVSMAKVWPLFLVALGLIILFKKK